MAAAATGAALVLAGQYALAQNQERFYLGASAGASDNIRDTIDYAEVVARLRADLAAKHFNLLEALAEHIATLVIEEFGAHWIRVRIAKLGMLPGVSRVGIVIERGAVS